MTRRSLPLLLAVVALAAAAATGAAGPRGGTLTYGTEVDPVALDGALAPDTASARVLDQVLEGLVGLAPGGTRVVPRLATRWQASQDARVWTFFLRPGVAFHDGTRLDAAAVCFNFERWYGFRGSLQRAAYYWRLVFDGFRRPEAGNPGPGRSLYRGCRPVGELTVRLRLARPAASFLAGLAYPGFGIASPAALRRYDADAGEVDAGGTFHPVGTYSTAHPSGTGPFRFSSWRPGRELVLVRNVDYWGPRAKLDRLVFRTISGAAARRRALERGAIGGYDYGALGDAAVLRRNPRLKVLDRPSPLVGFVGLNQARPPLDKLLVRQAVAYGLDRASVVRSFYGGRAVLADQFLPPAFAGHASDVRRYPYDPARSRRLLRRAGLTLPVKLDFWFPTEVSRPYMLDPKRNFETFAAGLRRAGFDVVAHSAPWSPDYIQAFSSGKAQLYLLGWIADVADPDDFFGSQFRGYDPAFGFRDETLFGLVARAVAEPVPARRAALYRRASRRVMEQLPLIPYAYFEFAVALRRNVTGYVASPTGPINESFATVALGPG